MNGVDDMSSSYIIDASMRAALTALDGLSLRQQAISRNIANIDTPGYKSEAVNFEDALRNALAPKKTLPLSTTSPLHIALTKTVTPAISLADRPGGSTRADGNNVDIDVELEEMAEAGIAYQAVSQAISSKLSLLKTIASR
jgi:flagellar basal-body rod protein FlgB